MPSATAGELIISRSFSVAGLPMELAIDEKRVAAIRKPANSA